MPLVIMIVAGIVLFATEPNPIEFIFIAGVAMILIRLYFMRVEKEQQQATQNKRLIYIQQYEFPNGIEKKLQKAYPHLNIIEVQQILAGLKEYFILCSLSDTKYLFMPSKAIDVAWHEFLVYTQKYQAFCRYAFGSFLHHVPFESSSLQPTDAAVEQGIMHTWELACNRESIDPDLPHELPFIFDIDDSLNIPYGHVYKLNIKETPRRDNGGGFYLPFVTATAFCGFSVSEGGCQGGCSDGGGAGDGDGGDGGAGEGCSDGGDGG